MAEGTSAIVGLKHKEIVAMGVVVPSPTPIFSLSELLQEPFLGLKNPQEKALYLFVGTYYLICTICTCHPFMRATAR